MTPVVNQMAVNYQHGSLIEGVKIGKIVKINPATGVLVDFPGNECGELFARFTKSIEWSNLVDSATDQLDLLLVFENSDPGKPIIIDILSPLISPSIAPTIREDDVEDELQDVCIDGKRIAFNAKEQITFKCGKASITLTKSGKIMLKGAYVLNRSSGALRLKGGSVQIN